MINPLDTSKHHTWRCPGNLDPRHVNYTYDALDRQTVRAESGPGAVQPGDTTLAYDGLGAATISETFPDTSTTTYTVDPDGDPVAVSTTAGTNQLLADDGRGNVTTATTLSGALACTMRYDPWGTPLDIANPGSTGHTPNTQTCTNAGGSTPDDLQYRSGRRDTTSGTYQLGSRTYDPQKAAFLSPDSYREGQPDADLSIGTDPLTRNTYNYVNGDPVNFTDPDGHMLCVDGLPCGGVKAVVHALEQQQQQKSALAQRQLADVAYAAQFLQAMDLYDEYWGTGNTPSSATEQRLVAAYAAFFQRAGAAYRRGHGVTQLQALALAHDFDRQGTTSDATVQTFLDAASLTGIGKLGVSGGRIAIRGILKGIDRVLAREAGEASLESLSKGAAGLLGSGNYTLYLAGTVEEPTYIGITRAFAARAAAHRLIGRTITPLVEGLSATEARGAEQVMIDYYGFGKLDNVINSIAFNNPIFYERIQEGISVLSRAGVLARLP